MTIPERQKWIDKIQDRIAGQDFTFMQSFINALLWNIKGTDEVYQHILEEAECLIQEIRATKYE